MRLVCNYVDFIYNKELVYGIFSFVLTLLANRVQYLFRAYKVDWVNLKTCFFLYRYCYKHNERQFFTKILDRAPFQSRFVCYVLWKRFFSVID